MKFLKSFSNLSFSKNYTKRNKTRHNKRTKRNKRTRRRFGKGG
jgi:hypothetical protein